MVLVARALEASASRPASLGCSWCAACMALSFIEKVLAPPDCCTRMNTGAAGGRGKFAAQKPQAPWCVERALTPRLMLESMHVLLAGARCNHNGKQRWRRSVKRDACTVACVETVLKQRERGAASMYFVLPGGTDALPWADRLAGTRPREKAGMMRALTVGRRIPAGISQRTDSATTALCSSPLSHCVCLSFTF